MRLKTSEFKSLFTDGLNGIAGEYTRFDREKTQSGFSSIHKSGNDLMRYYVLM